MCIRMKGIYSASINVMTIDKIKKNVHSNGYMDYPKTVKIHILHVHFLPANFIYIIVWHQV
jgi:hypothetical protein